MSPETKHKIHDLWNWQDGPVSRDPCYHGWRLEFHPQDPHGRKRKLTSARFPLICNCACGTHVTPHNKLKNAIKIHDLNIWSEFLSLCKVIGEKWFQMLLKHQLGKTAHQSSSVDSSIYGLRHACPFQKGSRKMRRRVSSVSMLQVVDKLLIKNVPLGLLNTDQPIPSLPQHSQPHSPERLNSLLMPHSQRPGIQIQLRLPNLYHIINTAQLGFILR